MQGLAIDPVNRLMFYSASSSNEILKRGLDGPASDVAIVDSSLDDPFHVVLDVPRK